MGMKLPVNSGGHDFESVPAGTHLAVCNLIADLGLQPGSAQYPKPKWQFYIRFEIPGERVQFKKDGVDTEGPMTIGAYYTACMGERCTLRKHLEAWRGRAFTDQEAENFDIESILGKACMLIIVRSEGDKTKISGIAGLPRGMVVPTAENELVYYDKLSPPQQWEKLPEWIKTKIGNQVRNTAAQAPASASGAGASAAPPQAAPAPQPAETTAPPAQGPGGMPDDDIPF